VQKGGSAVGSLLFLVVAPGTMAVLVPWLLTGWDRHEPPPNAAIRLVGVGLIAAGTAVLLGAFARFVFEGRGTPAPVAPTQRLVVGGLYRHVRNPMYLAVTATIVGQALLLGRVELVVYAALFLGTTAAFVRWYEEPTLRARYGPEYHAYRRAVPGWWPRLKPWNAAGARAVSRGSDEDRGRP
jgi:protein-S-isoprenylcysteine O-methyltransferase Ste14